jgi:predicted O-methyltransferase YrrM
MSRVKNAILTNPICGISNGIYSYFQRKKAERFFPFLRSFDETSKRISNEMAAEYKEYTEEISTRDMAISLNTAVFLTILCEALKPENIMDLGSGFSSFVLRSYARSREEIRVWSVDDSPEWLEHTKEFLTRHNLSSDRVLLWGSVERLRNIRFDLIFHDLGNMKLRKDSFGTVLKLGEKAIILLDDMHKDSYADFVRRYLRGYPHRYFNLQAYTLDQFGRYAGLLLLEARSRRGISELF